MEDSNAVTATTKDNAPVPSSHAASMRQQNSANKIVTKLNAVSRRGFTETRYSRKRKTSACSIEEYQSKKFKITKRFAFASKIVNFTFINTTACVDPTIFLESKLRTS